jgi:hypothetical protein
MTGKDGNRQWSLGHLREVCGKSRSAVRSRSDSRKGEQMKFGRGWRGTKAARSNDQGASVFDNLPLVLLQGLLRDKAKAQGVVLSEREAQSVARQILAGASNVKFGWWRKWDTRTLELDFTQDATRLGKLFDDGTALTEIVMNAAKDIGAGVLQNLERRWSGQWRYERRTTAGFRKRLERRWLRPLSILRMMTTISEEMANHAIGQMQSLRLDEEQPNLVAAVTRLHARSCQITLEILTLLESGFADGAMARWRTLHEVVVVMMLIAEGGEELAQRYIDHAAVQAFTEAQVYRDKQSLYGFASISDEEMRTFSDDASDARKRHGPGFGGQYGWAASYLKNKNPDVHAIESWLEMDYMRPQFGAASQNIHGNAKGTFLRLGLLDDGMLLGGASNAGLESPGIMCAASLLHANLVLLTLGGDFDCLVTLEVLASLWRRSILAFQDAAESLREDERMSAG